MQACALSLALPLLASCVETVPQAYVVECTGALPRRVMGTSMYSSRGTTTISIRKNTALVVAADCLVYRQADSAALFAPADTGRQP